MYRLDQEATRRMVAGLDNQALGHLADIVIREYQDRMSRPKVFLRVLTDAERLAGYQGLSNFMLGATRALACRATLRASKGHKPFAHLVSPHTAGGTPTSGEMWTAADGVAASFRPQGQCLNPELPVAAWQRYAINHGAMLLRW